MVLEITLFRVVVIDFLEEVGIEVGPFLEGEILPEHTRRDVLGDERCLDEQRARAAHRVDEVAFAPPSRHEDHACGQHLVEGGFNRLLTVSATVQRLAAGVEAEGGVFVGNVDVQADVGVGHRDVRTVARMFAELVDDGILHLIGHELGVAELLGEYHRVYGESLAVVEVFRPFHLHHLVVHVVGTTGFEVDNGFQNADSSVELEIGTVHQFFVACKRHHSTANLHVFGSQFGQFLCQDGLQAHECLGNQFEFHFSRCVQ